LNFLFKNDKLCSKQKETQCSLVLFLKKMIMGRNNEKNIKKHNDKLHKTQAKAKLAEMLRKEKLKEIVKKFNENNNEADK